MRTHKSLWVASLSLSLSGLACQKSAETPPPQPPVVEAEPAETQPAREPPARRLKSRHGTVTQRRRRSQAGAGVIAASPPHGPPSP